MPTPEENFYRVCHIVLDVIPKSLRELFKNLWNSKYPGTPWNDSPASGRTFLQNERNKTVRKTVNRNMLHGDCNQFDGTTLFSTLLYSSQNFCHGQPIIRANIDKLRIVRNECFAHQPSASVSDNDYKSLLEYVKSVFVQLGWSTAPIRNVEQKYLNTSHLKQLEDLLVSEGKRNRKLETRLTSLEKKMLENLKSMETKISVAGNKIEAIQTGLTLAKDATKVNSERLELLQSVAEIGISAAKFEIEFMETESTLVQSKAGGNREKTYLTDNQRTIGAVKNEGNFKHCVKS